MKDLTLRYSVTQFTHWAASSGAAAFATAYLLQRGVPSGTVGLLLALAGLLSCLAQPLLAGFADRAERFLLTKLLTGLSALCCLCFALQLLPGLPLPLTAALYMTALWGSDVMAPLLNALSVACSGAGYPLDYGAARGGGSAATALSSLVIGCVMARLGTAWMLLLLLAARICCIITLAGYPGMEKRAPAGGGKRESCSVLSFFSRYRRYCVSLLGVAFLGMFHAMTENYLIAILGALGGDSSHVGKALCISAMAAAPVIFFFSRIRSRIRDGSLLKIAAVTFLIKAVGFYFAGNIAAVYLLQLLQTTSYAFLAPAQVYYARARVRGADMVKGQAFATAAYALGCAGGNFAGGQLLGFGVKTLLLAGIAMAAAGTVLIFAAVSEED